MNFTLPGISPKRRIFVGEIGLDLIKADGKLPGRTEQSGTRAVTPLLCGWGRPQEALLAIDQVEMSPSVRGSPAERPAAFPRRRLELGAGRLQAPIRSIFPWRTNCRVFGHTARAMGR